MKYIRLYEERLYDFEIMVMPSEPLIRELKKEIEKEDYDLDYIRDLVFYGHFNIDVIWEMRWGQWTFLMRAAELNKPDIIKVLLEDGGADPNVKDTHGSTALHRASYNNHSQAIQALLKHPKIDPNVQNNYGSTALVETSYRGHLQAVQALLKHPKTDITITSKMGETAWGVATLYIREQFPELNPNRSER